MSKYYKQGEIYTNLWFQICYNKCVVKQYILKLDNFLQLKSISYTFHDLAGIEQPYFSPNNRHVIKTF